MKLLVVEDEILLQKIISKGLKKLGYAVDSAYDGEEALELIYVNDYDLVVLDLNLPKLDGLEVLRRIRQTNNELRVLILSARAEVEDRILGLDSGANDYLIKPFDFNELEARIRCLLRRNFIQIPKIINESNMEVDTGKKIVKVGGENVQLTKKEYSILEYLLINKGTVISAEKLMEKVWDSDMDLFSTTLKFHMSSLKKKLSNAGCISLIKNLRGVGYIIEEEVVQCD